MKHSVTTKILASGIDILYIDIPGTTTFDMAIATRSGYRFATKDAIEMYELPHILEHQIFDGSKQYQDSDALQDIFSQGGGYANGMTTSYHNIFPFHSRIAYAESVVKAAIDAVFFPLLAERSFDEEMKVVENELTDNMSDMASGASSYTQQQVLPNLPTSTDTQLDRLPNITLEAVRKYHKKYYTAQNTTIVIATDGKKLPLSHIEKLIIDVKIPSGKRHAFPKFEIAKANPDTIAYTPLNKSLQDSIASIQFTVPGTPELREELSLLLFLSIAGGMKSYSVNHKLRKRGLVYGMELNLSQSIEAYGLELDITANNEKFIDVFAYSLELIRDFIKDGLTKEQFTAMKKEFLDSFVDNESSTDAIMGWYLMDYLMDGRLKTVKEYQKIVSGITQDEMLAAVSKLYKYDHMYGTVFSAKGIRASTSMVLLAKEIIKKDKPVTTELIESNAFALTSKDTSYKWVTGSLLGLLGVLFVLPLAGIGTHLPTLSNGILSFPIFITVAVILYYFALCAILPLMQGGELRLLLANMMAYFGCLPIIMAIFLPETIMPYLNSGQEIVKLHGWGMLTVLYILALLTFWAYFRSRRAAKHSQKDSKKKQLPK